MRPSQQATRLERSAVTNLRRLGRLTTMASVGTWDRVSEDIVSYAAIEAQNTWGNFVRAYYISCWLGVRLKSGTGVTTTPVFAATTMDQVLGWAVNRYRLPKNKKKPGPGGSFEPRDEPAWFKLKTLLDLSDDLRCSNLSEIQAAVSAKPTVFNMLPDFRNFFAHRNRYTLTIASAAASSLGLPTSGSPAAALVYRPVTKTTSTLAEWLLDLEETVRDLCA